jgi:Flp pilus assembly protein TadD
LADRQACVAWALAALLLAGGCSQDHWFLAKSEAPGPSGSADAAPGGGASPANNSGGAADLKNPFTMARLCESRGQTAEAKRLYEEAIQRRPKDPAGYHGLALLYAKQGQFKEAEPCFARALALAPNQADLLGDMGYFCYLCSRNEEAERYLRRAVELEPNQPIYGNNLALVLGELRRDQESQDLFRRFGTEEQACANMAFVYAQRGEYAKALEMYNHVLTQDPKDHTAALAMLQISKLQDQRQRAGRQLVGQSPQPPAVPSSAGPGPATLAVGEAIARATPPAQPQPPAVPSSAGPGPATPAAGEAIARATPPVLPGDGVPRPTLRPAAQACSQVSAEVELSDDETSPGSEVRWPEGALEFDRFPAGAQ